MFAIPGGVDGASQGSLRRVSSGNDLLVMGGVRRREGDGTRRLLHFLREGAQLVCGDHTPAHFVPDALATTCHACQVSFSLVERRHHCRLCGQLFCGRCSRGRCALLGWGESACVRVCDWCEHLETAELPLLLAGDVWTVCRERSSPARRQQPITIRETSLVWLSSDQSTLVCTSWPPSGNEGLLKLARMNEVVQVQQTDASLTLVSVKGVRLELYGTEESARDWAMALQALLRVTALRRETAKLSDTAQQLVSGSAAVRQARERRANALLQQQQARLIEMLDVREKTVAELACMSAARKSEAEFRARLEAARRRLLERRACGWTRRALAEGRDRVRNG
mmetsp:Transcript_42082/g.104768  ORF Transcript_42082/g.104768 Transcript_42082/m.104768 type:complete len:339 (+) Transcript_42082:145-1161(+)